MEKWLRNLKYNPIAPLFESDNEAITAFARRDLLGEKVNLEKLWELPQVQKILKKQRSDGSWKYPGASKDVLQDMYDQLETWRQLGYLVEMFGFAKKHQAVQKAAKCIFAHQSKDGDFRGIYAKQTSPNFSAAMAELLIKAGYENDSHIIKHFKWLLGTRQNDSGWALAFRTRGYNLKVIYGNEPLIEPDPAKPSAWLITGAVLRAFAAHPKYRKSKEAKIAGELLAGKFFKRDSYPDMAAPEHWTKFTFPFDYTHLVSALDSLSQLNISPDNPQIQKGLDWLIKNQQKDGLWNFRVVRGGGKSDYNLWLALAVCRVFKKFYY